MKKFNLFGGNIRNTLDLPCASRDCRHLAARRLIV